MNGMGTVRVDENLYPIESLTLEPGAIVIRCWVRGPRSASQGPYRVYDGQGRAVLDSVLGKRRSLDLPKMATADTMSLTIRWNIERLDEGPLPQMTHDYRPVQ